MKGVSPCGEAFRLEVVKISLNLLYLHANELRKGLKVDVNRGRKSYMSKAKLRPL